MDISLDGGRIAALKRFLSNVKGRPLSKLFKLSENTDGRRCGRGKPDFFDLLFFYKCQVAAAVFFVFTNHRKSYNNLFIIRNIVFFLKKQK